MKYSIIKDEKAKFGYVCVRTDDDGSTVELALNSRTSDNCFKLPPEVTSATERKYIKIPMVAKAVAETGEYVIHHKDMPGTGVARDDARNIKEPLVVQFANYLDGSDRAEYERLVQLAAGRYREAQIKEAKMAAIAKKRAELEALEAQLRELEAE